MGTRQIEPGPAPAVGGRALPPPASRLPALPLRIRVRGPWLEGRHEIHEYARQRAESVLGHLARRVECIAFTGDIVERGPASGAFRCRVWARLTCGRQVREEATGADLYAAIDLAAEALARDVEYLEWRLPPEEAVRCA